MTDHINKPVALPPGSFDYETLKAATDKAAKGSAKNYDEAIADAIAKSGTQVHENQDPRDIPGDRFTDVKNEDLGVTERVQVFDAKLAEKAEDEQAAAIPPQAPTPAPPPETAPAAKAGSATKE